MNFQGSLRDLEWTPESVQHFSEGFLRGSIELDGVSRRIPSSFLEVSSGISVSFDGFPKGSWKAPKGILKRF